MPTIPSIHPSWLPHSDSDSPLPLSSLEVCDIGLGQHDRAVGARRTALVRDDSASRCADNVDFVAVFGVDVRHAHEPIRARIGVWQVVVGVAPIQHWVLDILDREHGSAIDCETAAGGVRADNLRHQHNVLRSVRRDTRDNPPVYMYVRACGGCVCVGLCGENI